MTVERLRPFFLRYGISCFSALPYSPELAVLPCRAAARIPENSRTILPFLLPYRVTESPCRNLSRYACVRDYHKVVEEWLDPLCRELEGEFGGQFVPFSDNSPFAEVDLAWKAGLGAKGDNGLLIHKTYGSYVFIGEIVTTGLFLSPIIPKPLETCLHCGACRRLCVGGALTEEGFAKEHCASFLSQKKGELSPWEQQAIRKSGLVWGCDRCQEVCPLNQNTRLSDFPPFLEGVIQQVTAENAKELCKEYAFGYRGEKGILRNLGLF